MTSKKKVGIILERRIDGYNKVIVGKNEGFKDMTKKEFLSRMSKIFENRGTSFEDFNYIKIFM